jgi:hypothetical protein
MAKPSARFEAVVLDGHKGLAFEVPFDPSDRWGVSEESLWPGRRGYRVKGSVNRVRFESVAVPRARRFFVLVTDDMRKTGRLRAGSAVKVSLSPAS